MDKFKTIESKVFETVEIDYVILTIKICLLMWFVKKVKMFLK